MTRAPGPGPFPPAGYRRWRSGAHDAVAWEPAADAVAAALEEAGSLHRWAATRSERAVGGGRGTVHVVRLGPIRAAVRHYRRGGWAAPVLGDRYLDRPPRPFAELAVAERLRARGVATPRIVAAIVTDARPGYRADLATEWLEGGHDLLALLRPGAYPDAARRAALEAAGETVGRAHAAGLDHPDLNVSNLLVFPGAAGEWTAALLDLDRARMAGPAGAKKKTSPASTAPSRRPAARAA